jgi:hypothetical protein
MKIALVRDGVVVNTVRGSQDFAEAIAADWDAVVVLSDDHPVSPGWTASGQNVSAPAEPTPVVPASVTMRQGREALIRAGLDEAVDAAIDAIQDPVARKIARNAWTMSNFFERHNGFISQLGPAVGLTEEQIDTLFIEASKL